MENRIELQVAWRLKHGEWNRASALVGVEEWRME